MNTASNVIKDGYALLKSDLWKSIRSNSHNDVAYSMHLNKKKIFKISVGTTDISVPLTLR